MSNSKFTKIKRQWRIYLFLLPTFILLFTYGLFPIGSSLYFSLLDWNGFGSSGRFVGLENYRELLQDKLFWNSFKNTFVFLFLAVPLRVGLAFCFAVLLNRMIPFRRIIRTTIFLPVVTTAAIMGVVMRFVFDPSNGPINILLLESGLIERPLNFLGSTGLALYTAVGIWVWKWLGITLIYWLAALQTIPSDLLEAAQIDGANGWQRFRDIMFPLLTPFTIIITLITVVEAANVFDLMLTLTAGGPFYATEVIDIFVYRTAFISSTPRLGYASAAALFFAACVILFSVIQLIWITYLRDRNNAGQ